MSDEQGNGQENGQQLPPMAINGQYIKDLSFESPNAPGVLADLQNKQPEINLNIDTRSN